MIETTIHDGVAILRMRHGKANALDLELCHGAEKRLKEMEAADVGAVVLTGEGNIFSAGVDLLRVVEEGMPYVREFLPALCGVIETALAFSKPLVMAINGHAVAGGCVLAAAGDRRIIADGNARMGVPELLVGVPFPVAALEAMRGVLAPADFQYLVYYDRVVGVTDALARGLVDAVVPEEQLEAEAVAAAAKLAAIAPGAFAATKAQVRGPVMERIAQGRKLDKEVAKHWERPETLDAIRRYVESTFKKAKA